MLGRDNADPLFLQFKEAEASVLEPFLGSSEYEQHGQRVVEGQRLMQAAGDIMLGWVRTSGVDGVERDYYVRQLWDAKGSALVETMNPTALTYYARVCGRTLARAHARAGDSVAIAAYLGRGDSFDRAWPGSPRPRRSERARLCGGRRGRRVGADHCGIGRLRRADRDRVTRHQAAAGAVDDSPGCRISINEPIKKQRPPAAVVKLAAARSSTSPLEGTT